MYDVYMTHCDNIFLLESFKNMVVVGMIDLLRSSLLITIFFQLLELDMGNS